MRIKRLGYAGMAVLLAGFIWSLVGASTTSLTIQIQGIRFVYPYDEIARVVFMDGFPVLSIHPPDPPAESDRNGILFGFKHLSKIKRQLSATGILDRHAVDTAGEFMELLYRQPGNDQSLQLLREVYEIDERVEFRKIRREPFTIYRVKHSAPREQRVYIVVDSDAERIYTVNGYVTDKAFERLSAGLSLAPQALRGE